MQKVRLSGWGTGVGSQADSHEPSISRCLSPGCLSPSSWLTPVLLCHFAVGKELPAFSQQPSVSLSSPFQQGEYISLRRRVPTYLECAGSRHRSMLVLEALSSVLSSSIWAANVPTRVSPNIFLNSGLQPKGVCTRPRGSQTPSPPQARHPLHTSRWAAWRSVPWVSSQLVGTPPTQCLEAGLLQRDI